MTSVEVRDKKRRNDLFPFIYALPSVCMGVLIMHSYGVSPGIYIQNLVFFVMGSALSFLYRIREARMGLKGFCVLTIFSMLFLIGSFFSAGTQEVHRWIQLGPIRLHAAFIILPILLILLNRGLQNGYRKLSAVLIFMIALALFLQPDASMITAFSVALIPLFNREPGNKLLKNTVLVSLLFLSAVCWIHIDHLEAVIYVEDILVLAREKGWGYLGGCVVSLAVAMWPFFKKEKDQKDKAISVSLGLFFLVLILSTVPGNFPVPLLGYGISPILGYLAAASYVMKKASVKKIDKNLII